MFASRAFTLMEILIVISIVSIIAASGSALGTGLYRGSILEKENDFLISVLIEARSRALANLEQKPHGIYIDDSNFIIYSGEFDVESNSNELFGRNQSIGVTPQPVNISFSQLSGDSNWQGSIILNDGERTRKIIINSEGAFFK